MAINYIHPSTNEAVAREPWRWVALYNDGTLLSQFEVGANGAIFHQSKEIDASKLIELQFQHDTYATISIAIPEGAKPVHLYRHKWITEEITDEHGEHFNREWRIKIWVLGFDLHGSYWRVYVDEYGHIVFSSDRELFLNQAMPQGVK